MTKPKTPVKKSKKHIAYESEKEAVREKAIQEYEANVAEIDKLLITPEHELSSEEQIMASWYRLYGYDNPDEKERRIREHVEKWESQRKITVAGEYRDEALLKARFQQVFVSFFQASRPEAFKELESFSDLYLEAFGTQPNNYLPVFDFQFREALLSADSSMATSLETILFEIPEIRPFLRYIKIRPRTYTDWDDEFLLGEFHLFSEFMTATLSSDDLDNEKLNTSLSGMMFEEIRFVTESDESTMDNDPSVLLATRKLLAEYVIAKITRADEPEYAFTQFRNRITHILRLNDEEKAIAAFIKLHTELLRWTKRHGLCKDWLLKYAYFYVERRALDPTIDLTNLPAPIATERSLFTDMFRFEFERWFPDGTSREEYERKLRAAFDREVERFFQYWGRHLNLDRFGRDRVKSKTRSFDPEFESVKWLIAWNEGATKEEIADAFNREQTVIRDGLKRLSPFALPCRVGLPGRRKRRKFSEDRLRIIKSLKL